MAANAQALAYGQGMWPLLTAPSVDAREEFIISRAQSLLTMDGEIGPRLSYAHAQDVIRWHEASPRRYL